jgi:hypothetical protein
VLTALLVGVVVAVALLAFLVAGLLRSNAELTRALHELGVDLRPVQSRSSVRVPTPSAAGIGEALPRSRTGALAAGQRAVDLTGTTADGEAITLPVTAVEHDTLLAFLSSGCATCRAFWEGAGEWEDAFPELPRRARLVAVTRGAEAEVPATLARLAGGRLPVVMSTDLWRDYGVPGAPYFIYISGPTGRVVGEGSALSFHELGRLVADATADAVPMTADGAGAGPSPAAGTSVTRDESVRVPQKSRADIERERDVDQELRAAGIEPGDPRLYPDSIDDGVVLG